MGVRHLVTSPLCQANFPPVSSLSKYSLRCCMHACIQPGMAICIWLHLVGHGSAKHWAETSEFDVGWLSRRPLPQGMLLLLSCAPQGPLRPYVAVGWPTANLRCLCECILSSTLANC